MFANPKSDLHFWDKPIDNVFIIRTPLLLDLIQKHKIDERFMSAVCEKMNAEIKQFTSVFWEPYIFGFCINRKKAL